MWKAQQVVFAIFDADFMYTHSNSPFGLSHHQPVFEARLNQSIFQMLHVAVVIDDNERGDLASI